MELNATVTTVSRFCFYQTHSTSYVDKKKVSIIFNEYSLNEHSLIAGANSEGNKVVREPYINLLISNSLSLISDVKVIFFFLVLVSEVEQAAAENIIYMFHLACPRLCVRLKNIMSHE